MENVDTVVIWLSYNAAPIIDVARRSLLGFLNLNYDRYKVIFVDNASTDDSPEKLLNEVKKAGLDDKLIFIRNRYNAGYTGGMNKGFQYIVKRLPSAEYVAFATNDLIPYPDSLREAIKALRSDERLACVGGLIYYPDERTIYAAGNWIDGLLAWGGVCQRMTRSLCHTVDVESYVSFVDGAYMVCKFKLLVKLFGKEGPFLDEAFGYYDDGVLGLFLWNRGYRVKYIPVDFGVHIVSSTFKRVTRHRKLCTLTATVLKYYTIRTRYSKYIKARMLKIRLASLVSSVTREALRRALTLKDKAVKKYGILDLHKAPYVPPTFYQRLSAIVPFIRGIGKRLGYRRRVTHEDFVIEVESS